MPSLCCKVLSALKGKTLVTAESCTGGGIGAALTAIPGSAEVYKGGIISYTNWVKHNLLGVPRSCWIRWARFPARWRKPWPREREKPFKPMRLYP